MSSRHEVYTVLLKKRSVRKLRKHEGWLRNPKSVIYFLSYYCNRVYTEKLSVITGVAHSHRGVA